MYPSIEVRWFFEDEPKNIVEWFSTMHDWPPRSDGGLKFRNHWERSDYYLKLDDYSKMSFKIRDGKTEIKILEESYGVRSFPNRAMGVVEKWIKWSPMLNKKNATPTDIFANANEFQEVAKERLLLKYEIQNGENLVRVDPNRDDLENGGQVEITRVKYNEEIYFSFGIEALGEDHLIMQNFDLMANTIFSKLDPQKLSEENSYSYPQFLTRRV